MEFIINKESLNQAIVDVSKAVSSKTPFPILTGIKMSVDENGVILIGSNSDIIIEKYIPLMRDGKQMIQVQSEGSVVVPAKFLSEIVKKMPDDLHIKVDHKNVVTIQSREIITNINGLNSEEYPNLPVFNGEGHIRMVGSKLFDTIKRTAFAASQNEMKPILTGVNMSFSPNKLVCAATNSHRLALCEQPIESNLQCSVVIPRFSLNELIKLSEFESSVIDLYITNNYFIVKSEATTLYSRLIEGAYPHIAGLIPKDGKTKIILNTNQFLQGIDRACLFANEWRNNNVHLSIEGEKLKISSNASEIGKIEETQAIISMDGFNELSISLDGRFLMDALKAISDEEIKISFGGTMKPILIEPVGNSAQLHLISPVRSY
ncbi:DNA polymerase III subunit beta [Heyndrickxia oleronia]|uniref:DNA polymerase III subunit beta n=1 Tax=Heyndrickxia oleronia TaxID=38875 RepID=UPI001B1193AC|nr:DNA polymerase III subunit beta [Heyndrickxia oleronia]GIN41898.1 DNA polymerase III subunit beta [Heyndrickxia oleronia]